MTASSTTRSTIQSASAQVSGLVPTAFARVLAVDFDGRDHDGSHVLVHVTSRDLVRHRPLLVGAERVPHRTIQGLSRAAGPPRAESAETVPACDPHVTGDQGE
jgi:hypothetical protein